VVIFYSCVKDAKIILKMKTILRIAKTELMTLFFSPVAWLVLFIFACETGYEFVHEFASQIKSQGLGYNLYNATAKVFSGYGSYRELMNNLYFYIPLLTMGLVSRELGSGSIKLLFSSPLSISKIIIGKYLAMVTYCMSFVVLMFLPAIFGEFSMKDLDIPVILSSLLGIYLLICCYSAIGLFISCLTSYQVVAAFGTFGILAVLSMVGRWWQGVPFVQDVTYWLSISGRVDPALEGLICSEDILYFFIIIGLFLSFSIIKIKSLVSVQNTKMLIVKYVGVFVLVSILGFTTSRATMKHYYDCNFTKSRTLTENSQEVMNSIKGEITLTTYCNIIDGDFSTGSPSNQNYDTDRFEKYIRFRPHMNVNYVYYWHKCPNPSLAKYYKGMTMEEVARKKCKTYGMDFEDLLTETEIEKLIDLSGEDHLFVREITTTGCDKKARLRMYQDNQRHPRETEITTAFKSLVVASPKVGFLQGHGERVIDRNRNKDFSAFVNNRSFRSSLMNQGFTGVNVTLETGEIPADINILVIADIRKAFTETELKGLAKYVERGGNLIVTGEVGHQEKINPFLSNLDVQLLPGQIVQPVKDLAPNIIGGNVLKEAAELSRRFQSMVWYKQKLAMDGVAGITLTKNPNQSKYKFIPLVASNNQNSWNELEQTDFEDLSSSFNPEKGEVMRANVLAMALSRKVGDKEQKIIVLGDSDCISNGELGRSRNKIRASNFSFIPGMFSWLSDGEYPINTSRVRPPDDKVYCDRGDLIYIKSLFWGLIPLMILLFGGCLLIRRRRR